MLNENIKQMRKSNGYTQEELASKLGVVRQTVSKWEKGLSVPDSEMLIKIAEFFETSVTVLLGETINTKENEISIAELSEKLSLINEQLANEKETKRKTIKSISIIGIVGVVIYTIIKTFMYFNTISYVNNDDVVGTIIGGADGPTTIFVASSGVNYKTLIIVVIIFILSIIGIIVSRKKR